MKNSTLLHLITRNYMTFNRSGYQTIKSFSCSSAKSSTLTNDVNEPQQKPILKMKGWQIHGYGQTDELQFSDKLKMPQIRNSDDCLVKVLATSVNPIDVAMLGGYGSTVLSALRCERDCIEFPLTFGREFCGVITQKGMNVNDFKLPVGERVWGVVPVHQTSGAHAEYVAVPQHCLSLAPRNLTDEEAAAVLYAGLTAWSGLYVTANLGGISGAISSDGGGLNKRVLVLGGSGSVGSLAIQMLKAQGAQVLATCSDDAKKMVKCLGADGVIDYKNQAEMHSLLSYGPFDIVLDCSGQGVEGAENLDVAFSQYVTFSSPVLKNIDVSGMAIGLMQNITSIVEANVKSIVRQRGVIKWGFFVPAPQGIELLKQLVERNKLLPMVDEVFEFSQMPKAFDRVKAGHLRGKVVVKVV